MLFQAQQQVQQSYAADLINAFIIFAWNFTIVCENNRKQNLIG
jgi:hypothetical protein